MENLLQWAKENWLSVAKSVLSGCVSFAVWYLNRKSSNVPDNPLAAVVVPTSTDSTIGDAVAVAEEIIEKEIPFPANGGPNTKP